MSSHDSKLAARPKAEPVAPARRAAPESLLEAMLGQASTCLAIHAMQLAGTVVVLAALTGLSGYRPEWVRVTLATWLGAAPQLLNDGRGYGQPAQLAEIMRAVRCKSSHL
jgi:hypothetical protein